MSEFLRFGRGEEGLNINVELRPRMAVEVARLTGGNLVLEEDNRWEIKYRSGSIVLAGYQTSKSPIPEYTIPYLTVYADERAEALDFCVPIFYQKGIMLINPGPRGSVSGYDFKDGDFHLFEIPLSQADQVLIDAKEKAVQKVRSQGF